MSILSTLYCNGQRDDTNDRLLWAISQLRGWNAGDTDNLDWIAKHCGFCADVEGNAKVKIDRLLADSDLERPQARSELLAQLMFLRPVNGSLPQSRLEFKKRLHWA